MKDNEEKIQVTTDNSYIEEVVKGIKNKNYKKLVSQELECHLYDRIEYYKELGYDDETATAKATEDMGDPEEIAIPLNTLHSQKWYRQPLNIVVIAAAVVQVVLLALFPIHLRYNFSYHYIYKDFISLGLFFINCIILYLGHKTKSKPVLIAQGITFATHLYFEPYQPMFYGVIKIIRSGFKNYINSIFSYGFLSETAGKIISYIVIVALLVLVGIALTDLYKSERGNISRIEKKKFRKIYEISKRTLVGFMAGNFLIMSVCTTIAYTNRFDVIEENAKIRGDIVRFALNLELKGNSADKVKEEIKQFYKESGYDYDYRLSKSMDEFVEVCSGDTLLFFGDVAESFSEMGENGLTLSGAIGTDEKSLPEVYNSTVCSLEELDFAVGMTIDDFCKTNLAEKVYQFNTSISQPSTSVYEEGQDTPVYQENDIIEHDQVYIRMEDEDTMIIDFEDNVCVGVESYNHLMSYFDTEKNDEYYGVNEDVEYEVKGDVVYGDNGEVFYQDNKDVEHEVNDDVENEFS